MYAICTFWKQINHMILGNKMHYIYSFLEVTVNNVLKALIEQKNWY